MFKDLSKVKRRTALILCAADPNSNPRPNRMIHWLKDDYDVTVTGWNAACLDGVASAPLFGEDQPDFERIAAGKYQGIKRYTELLLHVFRLFTGRYEEIVWSRLGRGRELCRELSSRKFDLIVSHDITLLPLAFGLKGDRTKVVLDAREYYTREYEDSLKWKLLTRPVNRYLCNKYLPQCDKILTVNEGLAQEYAGEFGVLPEVVMSLPRYVDLSPSPVNGTKIRIMHHGFASLSRRTETMIEMMDYLDERFSLDMMLIVSQGTYWDKIVSMAGSRKNVRIIPPLRMEEIVPFTNKYDIGLYLCPPTSFNQKYTLPNKFFEFIQARLAVAIGPSIEMKKIVEQYDCGVVSDDFDPRSLAAKLSSLSVDKIFHYKQQSHQAASVLCSEVNRKKVQGLFHDLLARIDHK
jgi:hypothetical protein